MKKLLRNFLICIFAVTTSYVNAQLPLNSVAPNWTFTDMNGNSHSLYSTLDSGYSVIMDVSATWCGPCWNYHQTGALENLYNQYGLPGTNEVRVFWVEGDGATSDGCMTNSGCVDPNHNNQSQGCWTCGTPFPMFNPPSSQANSFNNNYDIAYFPTVYRICPNRLVKEITQPTASEAYSECQQCPPPASQANDPAIIQYTGTMVTCGTVDIKVVLQNNGTSALTSCTITAMDGANQVAQFNWTGNLATYATQTVTVGTATISADANLNISITSTDNNTSNNSVTQLVTYRSVNNLPEVLDFESTFLPAGWSVNDLNNDDLTWMDGAQWAGGAVGGYGQSNNCIVVPFYYSPSNAIDELYSAQYDLTNAASAQITFDLAYAQYSNENDKLEVLVSTNCSAATPTWTSQYSKQGSAMATASPTTSNYVPASSEWRTDTVDLSSFIGQSSVNVKFKATSKYGNNLYLDNINFSAVMTGINTPEVADESLQIYPNPSNGIIYVSSLDKKMRVIVYNTLGEVVHDAINNFIDLSKQPNGIYTVKAISDKHTTIKKVTINK